MLPLVCQTGRCFGAAQFKQSNIQTLTMCCLTPGSWLVSTMQDLQAHEPECGSRSFREAIWLLHMQSNGSASQDQILIAKGISTHSLVRSFQVDVGGPR